MGSAIARPTLIGVGVGPGDPELVTVKAVRALESSDVVLVPATEASADAAGRAETIVVAACPSVAPRLRRIPFAMTERRGVGEQRHAAWTASAAAAVEAFTAGATRVAFATVGDPSVYSTFAYLAALVREAVADLDVVVVPGITAMQALAAASGTPLLEGRERLTLVPVTAGLDAVADALDHADTVVAYKVGRHLPDVARLAAERGRAGIVGVDVSLPGQQLSALQDDAARAPYFSTVFLPARRHGIGGAL